MFFEYIEFPAIGLHIPVTRTLFKVFGQDIYTYAVIIALSIVLMIVLGLRHAERYGIKQDIIIDFMIFAMPASIICARIYYVIFSWENYRDNIIDVINIRQGGIAMYGAVIGSFLTVLIFSKVRKMDALRFLDFGVPYLLLAQGIGRWGNFVNQEAFGANTTLPWGMTSSQITAYLASNAQKLATFGIAVDPSLPVHPTFLYESIWNIVIACVLFWMRRRMKYRGEVLCGYLIGYGVGRAFIEGLRTDSLMLGSIRMSQLVSILLVILCLVMIIFFRKKFVRYDALPASAVSEPDVVSETDDGSEADKDDDDYIDNDNDISSDDEDNTSDDGDDESGDVGETDNDDGDEDEADEDDNDVESDSVDDEEDEADGDENIDINEDGIIDEDENIGDKDDNSESDSGTNG